MARYYLKTLRLRRQYTQVELTRISKVPQKTISNLESHQNTRPTFATVAALAKALHVRPEQLCFGPDPKIEREKQQELAS
jgi:XRE family transcriptional regulator, regulator of sulfur utilization